MSAIGKLTLYQKLPAGNEYRGSLRTLEHQFSLRLLPQPNPDGNANRPSHRVFAILPDGTNIPFGAAWLRVSKAASHEGEEFFSLTLDDPSFSKPLNLAAFSSGKADEFEITFRRRSERAATNSATA